MMAAGGVWYWIQWLHYLALSLWVGGITFLAAVAAPAAHRSLISRAVAGEIVGHILKRLNLVELACAATLLGTTANAFWFVSADRYPRLWVLTAVISMMGLLTFYYRFFLTPRLESLKEKIPTLDTLSATHPSKFEFDRLHRIYVQLMSLNLILGLALLYGSVVVF